MSFDWEAWELTHRDFPDREKVEGILREASRFLPAGSLAREVKTLLEHGAIASALDSLLEPAQTDPRLRPLLLAAVRLMRSPPGRSYEEKQRILRKAIEYPDERGPRAP